MQGHQGLIIIRGIKTPDISTNTPAPWLHGKKATAAGTKNWVAVNGRICFGSRRDRGRFETGPCCLGDLPSDGHSRVATVEEVGGYVYRNGRQSRVAGGRNGGMAPEEMCAKAQLPNGGKRAGSIVAPELRPETGGTRSDETGSRDRCKLSGGPTRCRWTRDPQRARPTKRRSRPPRVGLRIREAKGGGSVARIGRGISQGEDERTCTSTCNNRNRKRLCARKLGSLR